MLYMRKIILCAVSCISFVLSYGQSDQKVGDLLNSQDYLELKRILPSVKNSLTYPILGELAEAGIYCSFNEPEKAVASITSLLNNRGGELGFDNFCNYIVLLSMQLIKLNRFEEAISALKTVEEACTDESLLMMLRSQLNLVRGLSLIPPSEVIKVGNTSERVKIIEGINNATDHWYIPVEIENKVEPFLFDTGAAYSFVSTNFAKRHNVKIVADSISVGSLNNQFVYASFGFIESVKIGNVQVSNLPVIVGDTDVHRDSFALDAVLGVPFMESVGSIKIYPNAMEMSFLNDLDIADNVTQNMMNYSGTVSIDAYCKDSRLHMFCDTGARLEGWIKESVYKNNPTQFAEISEEIDSIKMTGFGGHQTVVNARNIPSVQFKIGDTSKGFNNMKLVEEMKYDGMLGIYFFKQFEEIILDFNRMFLHVK